MTLKPSQDEFAPLAARMRPRTISEFVGQAHLLSEGRPLYKAIQNAKLHSMILWGPPGTGKTTLAQLMADKAGARVEKISAVLAGVKEVREIVARAEQAQRSSQATVLFVDEVHRFNKGQQDAFLPHVERGTITLIGATTENPSFQLNNALLSRTRVYVIKPLSESDLLKILQQALTDSDRGLGKLSIVFPEALQKKMIAFADGDARQCLNLLALVVDFAEQAQDYVEITQESLNQVLSHASRRFDNHGEYFYDQISAMHKAVRGSDPDAALYWLCCMLASGCDPFYLARRIVRLASEDIGNADPRALQLALNAWESFERVGSPEGELVLAQAVIYCACAAKSNAVYKAFNAAMKDVKQKGTLEVPMHIRNAPTKLMKSLGYAKNYRYAHDEPDAFAAGVRYLPDALSGTRYYEPVERGLEIKIKEKMDYFRQLNQQNKLTEPVSGN